MTMMRRLFAIVLVVIYQPALAFDETYYVRDDDGGPYGNQSGVGWANAFAGMAAVSYGTGAGQVGPGDLLCLDGEVANTADTVLSQGGTSAVVPLTVSGSGYSGCNDASDTGSGTLRKTQTGGTAALTIHPSAQFVVLRDVTIRGGGTSSVGADGLRTGTRGQSQTGIQVGPNVVVMNASDEGVELGSNTVGGVEVDCDPVFGSVDASSCEFALKVDNTRNDGIACYTPGAVVRKFQIHNSGRNIGGNNDGLAVYDDANTDSDCWGGDFAFGYVTNHSPAGANAGSAAIDVQITGTPPVGLEYVYLRSILITDSVRCAKANTTPTKISGVITQACDNGVQLEFNADTEWWNSNFYGSHVNMNTNTGETRNQIFKNNLSWVQDGWLNDAANHKHFAIALHAGPSKPNRFYYLDHNVYRDDSMFGYTHGDSTCQANYLGPNGCLLAVWTTVNAGSHGAPWDTNSQETATSPFVGPLPSVNEGVTTTDRLDPAEADTGMRLAVAHLARTAGIEPPVWVQDFCGNDYVDAGGGEYAVGAFEPSNTSCDVWAGVSGPGLPAGPNKRSFGGTPATGGIW